MKRLFPLAILAAAAFALPTAPAVAEDTITIGFTALQTAPTD
jgi:hypothetical protein